MKKGFKLSLDIILRYSILVIAGILNVNIFYFFFSFLTVYPVYFLLGLFYESFLNVNTIWINNLPIEIIGPCVAGSAYYLLLILNLSTPGIKFVKRILSLIFSFSLLLIINILRIFILSLLLISGSSFFDLTHKLIWVIGSVLFVIGVWFLTVKIFKIKEIPLYSDIRILCCSSKNQIKKTKSHKKH